MNIDFRKILIIILGSLWLWLMISILYGCSANYHFGKFLKKGGTIDTTERIVSVEKVIKVNGKDSIILVEMPLNCPSVQIPPTRLETRLEYRLKHDSIKTLRYITKWKTKKVVKTKRIEAKSYWWIWYISGAVSVLLIILIWNRL